MSATDLPYRLSHAVRKLWAGLPIRGENVWPEADNDLFRAHASIYLFFSGSCDGKRVLDAGCGAGYGAAMLAEAGAAEVLAVDDASLGEYTPDAFIQATQQVIEAEACAPLPAVSPVVPECVHRLIGMDLPNGIDPALFQQLSEQRSRLGLNERIVGIGLRRIDVGIGRHDVQQDRANRLGASGEERRLVQQVRQVGAHEARRAPRHRQQVHVGAQRDPARVDGQDGQPAERPEPVKGVYVLDGNKVKFVPVETGITGETEIQIVAGLSEGQEVITGPSRVLNTLKEDTTVKKQEKPEGTPSSV